jgi:hypothetical protein
MKATYRSERHAALDMRFPTTRTPANDAFRKADVFTKADLQRFAPKPRLWLQVVTLPLFAATRAASFAVGWALILGATAALFVLAGVL